MYTYMYSCCNCNSYASPCHSGKVIIMYAIKSVLDDAVNIDGLCDRYMVLIFTSLKVPQDICFYF